MNTPENKFAEKLSATPALSAVSYKVTASSHIGPVAYTITTEIASNQVAEFLAKGVKYEGQRAAASKAMKAVGAKRRGTLAFDEEVESAVREALLAIFPDATLETSEHVKGVKADVKFVAAHKILAFNKDWDLVAKLCAFEGETTDEDGEPTQEFLRAVTDFKP